MYTCNSNLIDATCGMHVTKNERDAWEFIHPEDFKFAKQHFYDDKLTIFRIDPEDLPMLRHSSVMPVVVVTHIQDMNVLKQLIDDCGVRM